ncbi:hypothetical protein RND71_008979 [Anisodus tanguticus]|uniref:Uncharacterized protein n=1 Tax=Anisodus tanguticus TaxID=243964 RepID=A0AAE1SPT1_9SOLA|nr:hypothetical protein RND71_008979 [Anisodus tanguticus]
MSDSYAMFCPKVSGSCKKWLGIGPEMKLSNAEEVIDQVIVKYISMKSDKLRKREKSMEDEDGFDLLTSYIVLNDGQTKTELNFYDNFLRDTTLNYMIAECDGFICSQMESNFRESGKAGTNHKKKTQMQQEKGKYFLHFSNQSPTYGLPRTHKSQTLKKFVSSSSISGQIEKLDSEQDEVVDKNSVGETTAQSGNHVPPDIGKWVYESSMEFDGSISEMGQGRSNILESGVEIIVDFADILRAIKIVRELSGEFESSGLETTPIWDETPGFFRVNLDLAVNPELLSTIDVPLGVLSPEKELGSTDPTAKYDDKVSLCFNHRRATVVEKPKEKVVDKVKKSISQMAPRTRQSKRAAKVALDYALKESKEKDTKRIRNKPGKNRLVDADTLVDAYVVVDDNVIEEEVENSSLQRKKN